MTIFTSMNLYNWRQFSDVKIEFHPRLTIITGSNGAGKSTILNICSQHFGYSRPFLSTPRKRRGGGYRYDLGYYRSSLYGDGDDDFEALEVFYDEDETGVYLGRPSEPSKVVNRKSPEPGTFNEVGEMKYDNGVSGKIGFYEHEAQSYGIEIQQQQPVVGVPISSHRTISNYQQVQGLPLQVVALSHAYNTFANEYHIRQNGGNSQFSPLYRMKEALIGMAAFGQGNEHLEKNEELSATFEGFGSVLKQVLPKELGFQKIVVRIPDIVLKTRAGEFLLDASSGGVTAVIEIAWQLYLFSRFNESFSVTLDEPENHLHPSMQRSILSNLVEAFPQAQFIVATHSPFIVSAVEDSQVYALKYTSSVGSAGFPSHGPRRVQSVALDQRKKAGTASAILKEVLGVSVSIPEWANKRLDGIIADFDGAEVVPETLKRLRAQLTEAGFAEFYPEALARLVETK